VASDVEALLALWRLLYAGDVTGSGWTDHARQWFAGAVDAPDAARFPVVEVAGRIVGTAVGTLELGVPNPHCARGRSVRLAHLVVLPDHRGQGHGARLAADVVNWARAIGADRVDLSATDDGQRLYRRLGFTETTAPRMKLVL
jgi:GNAT superfamily N-acetyltransferase